MSKIQQRRASVSFTQRRPENRTERPGQYIGGNKCLLGVLRHKVQVVSDLRDGGDDQRGRYSRGERVKGDEDGGKPFSVGRPVFGIGGVGMEVLLQERLEAVILFRTSLI